MIHSAPSRRVALSLMVVALALVALMGPFVAHAVTLGHITGTVTNGTGPLQDIVVNADVLVTYPDGDYWEYAGDTQTDSTGHYDIGDLAPGTYRLQFQDSSGTYASEYFDNAASFYAATDIPVAAGATVSGKNAVLGLAGHITGTVTNGTGPLQDIYMNVFVRVSDPVEGYSWDYVSDGQTGPTGYYDIGDLAPGTYRLEFYDSLGMYATEYFDNAPSLYIATDIPVATGVTVSGKNAVLSLAGHITGTVTNGTGPVKDISVTACVRISDPVNGDWWDSVGYAQTDSTGLYDVGNLLPGTYRLEFQDGSGMYRTECYDNSPSLDDANDVPVTAGATTSGKNAVLDVAAHITGTIRNGGGVALPGIYANAYTLVSDPVRGDWWRNVGYGRTDSAGFYDIGDLPAGTYRLQFFDYSDTYARECYDNALSLFAATDVPVAGGATASGKDAVLSPAGHITGTVRNGGGAALPNIFVSAFVRVSDPVNGDWWDSVAYGVTGPAGAYDVGDLAPGTYRLEFWDDSGTYPPEYYDNAASVQAATDIPVAAGATTSGKDAVLGAVFTYTITPSAGANGIISPATLQTVARGGSAAFTITPAVGYHVVDVLVDGASVGPVTAYTFTNITTNHTIAASFAATPVTLSTTTKLYGPTSVRVRKTLKLRGTVAPAASVGKVTIVKARQVGRKWKSMGSAKVSVVKGAYRYSFKPTKKGKWRLYAKYSGGTVDVTTYKASKSKTRYVKVK